MRQNTVPTLLLTWGRTPQSKSSRLPLRDFSAHGTLRNLLEPLYSVRK